MPVYSSIRYDPIGHCIYCGARNCELGDEHIIPESLNGHAVLPDASCGSCEAKICKIEGYLARRTFWSLRLFFNFRSKRSKNKRPGYLDIELSDGTHTYYKRSDIQDAPITTLLFAFQPPGILLGLPPTDTFKNSRMWWLSSGDTDAYMRQLRGQRLRIGPFRHRTFARLLAKIGRGLAVAELGEEAFQPIPSLCDMILGRSDDLPYLVGGDFDIKPPSEHGHEFGFEYKTINERRYVVVRLRLLAWLGTPTYRVVVGEVDPNVEPPRHLSAG